ncbi:GAF and ANTAR domain-containing protein [Actinomycetospora atypica]|uniref:GAF and ANTAR domain-containing protein n=1 Tax=Actinomycetospora atypica TaxID=1290095 RepID=A0ABV9YKN2_9PSEU
MTCLLDDQLVVALRTAASGLVRQNIRDMDNVLTQIVASAAQTVPGADGGGISRTEQGTVRACHATHEVIRDLDRLQVDRGQGPSSLAADDPPAGGVVIAHDLASRTDSDRWPSFAPAAVRAGYRSIMSAQLTSSGRGRHAALNLYAHEPDVFTAHAQNIAGLYSAQASLLLYGADQADYLQRAVESRDLIGQAKGILMERFDVTADQAFEMLINSSQETNVKLVDVARWLTRDQESRSAARPTPLWTSAV